MNALTIHEQEKLEILEAKITAGLQTFVEVGAALLEIRDSRLYRQWHGTFEDYCRERWGFARRTAYQLMEAAEVVENVRNCAQIEPANEAQARPLTRLEPEIQPIAWGEAVATAPNGKVTAAHVEATVRRFVEPVAPDEDEGYLDEVAGEESGYDWTEEEPDNATWLYSPNDGPAWCKYCYESHSAWEASSDHVEPAWNCLRCDHTTLDRFMEPESPFTNPVSGDAPVIVAIPKPHVSHNSGNNEWYTPAEYIEAARRVMGHIDLDPATSYKANEVVRAETIYTVDNDGLAHPWSGRVWMNPPYAAELITRFAAKMVEHVRADDVQEAVILVNNATETGWFCQLIEVATAVVFPRSRVRFWQPDGKLGAPLQGQAIIYAGPKPSEFLYHFRDFGWGAVL